MTQDVPSLPTYAAIYRKGEATPIEVTMNQVTMAFYLGIGCIIEPIIPAAQAAAVVTAARAMSDVYKLCFQRATFAKAGDRVMFDNSLNGVTSDAEQKLSKSGLTIGGVYTVESVVTSGPEVGFIKVYLKIKETGEALFDAQKFIILPK